MKKTLADLLDPNFDHYRSVGELARTLQFLMASAEDYRDHSGRWGSSGPGESLSNYGGCTNHVEHDYLWHSGRIASTCPWHPDVTTWQQNHDCLYKCILAGLCGESKIFERWRKEKGINLHMQLKFQMAYQHHELEQSAWKKFMELHRHQLNVPTLNICHKRVNLLAAPQLIIRPSGVTTSICVTQKSEMRESPQCYSRWEFKFLMRDTKWGTNPKWNCQRETFAEFILRAVAFYKSVPSSFAPKP